MISLFNKRARNSELLARNAITAGEMTKWRLNVVLCGRPCGIDVTVNAGYNQRREESNSDCAGTPEKCANNPAVTSEDSIVCAY